MENNVNRTQKMGPWGLINVVWYYSPRIERDKKCVLVIIGADEWGHKDIIGIEDGCREEHGMLEVVAA